MIRAVAIDMNTKIQKVAALAAAFLFIFSIAAAAQDATPRGLVVDSQTVAGNSRISAQEALADNGIRPGDTITISDVQRALRVMWRTGNFKNIEPHLVP